MSRHPKNADRILREQRGLVTDALQHGVRDAFVRHARMGQPVVIWRNGQIEWVPAQDLLDAPSSMVAERPDPEDAGDE